MGYYTTVDADLLIKTESVPQLLADIERAATKVKEYEEWMERKWAEVVPPLTEKQREETRAEGERLEASYLEYHVAQTTLEEIELRNREGENEGRGWVLTPSEEDQKWYGLQEYLQWLEKHVLDGTLEWHGDDRDDYGAVKWENDKVYCKEWVWKEVSQ